MWEGGEGGCSKESVCEGRRLIMPLQSYTREEIHQLTCHISLYSHLMHQSTVLRASQHETSSDPGEVGNYKGKEERRRGGKEGRRRRKESERRGRKGR